MIVAARYPGGAGRSAELPGHQAGAEPRLTTAPPLAAPAKKQEASHAEHTDARQCELQCKTIIEIFGKVMYCV